jgi:hypothetical protein
MDRPAVSEDVEAMLDLAERRREQYQEYAPIFQKPAPKARDAQRPYFHQLVQDSKFISLVHEDGQHVDGFIIASLMPAPPVYDPGGATCLVDDFMVEHPRLWSTVGKDLLKEACQQSQTYGAVQVVVVCGPFDHPKRALLQEQGLFVASEWFTRPF